MSTSKGEQLQYQKTPNMSQQVFGLGVAYILSTSSGYASCGDPLPFLTNYTIIKLFSQLLLGCDPENRFRPFFDPPFLVFFHYPLSPNTCMTFFLFLETAFIIS